MITHAKTGIHKPKLYSTVLTNNYVEPTTFKQVSTNPTWLKDMELEYNALIANNT